MIISSQSRGQNADGLPPGMRPSTSPVPNFYSTGGLKKGPSPSGNRPTPPSAALLGQASSANLVGGSRLRPLPPARGLTMPTGFGGGGGMGMCIEGRTTGEEKTVAGIERRESNWARVVVARTTPTAAECPADGSRDQTANLQKQLRKMETDFKKSQEQLRKKQQEITDLKTQMQSLSDAVDEANRRATEMVGRATNEAAEKDVLIAQLRAQLEEERLRSTQHQSEGSSKLRASHEEWQKTLASWQEKEKLWQQDRNTLLADKASLEKALQQETTKTSELGQRLGLLQQQNKDLQEQLQGEQKARQMEADAHVTQVASLTQKLQNSEQTLKDWTSRINLVNSFIVRICQPKFSVVKDETLTPLDPKSKQIDGQEQGFVMVPLKLLLEGYGLLPNDTKKSIADEYESSKKGSQ